MVAAVDAGSGRRAGDRPVQRRYRCVYHAVRRGPGDGRNRPGEWRTTYLGGARMGKRMCTTEGCSQRTTARGLCHRHYQAWHRAGGVTTKVAPLEERFWARVRRSGPLESPTVCRSITCAATVAA